MGLFGNKSKENDNKKQGEIQSLLEIDFQEGEFTLPNFFWGHLSRYKYLKEKNILTLEGDKFFTTEQIQQLIGDFISIFGIDTHGGGIWTEDDEFNLVELGTADRAWYLDENYNCKPYQSDFFKNLPEGHQFKIIIFISCDKNDDETGMSLEFHDWSGIKNKLKTK